MGQQSKGWVYSVSPSGFGWAVTRDCRVIRRFTSREEAEEMLAAVRRHPAGVAG